MRPNVDLSKFRKIDPAESLWLKLVKIAKTFEPELAEAFLRSVEKLRSVWAIDKDVDPRLFEALEKAVQQTTNRSANAEILRVNVQMAFDQEAPTAAMLVKQEVAMLVKEVSDATQAGISEAVGAGIRQGKGAAAIAREVRLLIGLTKQQALAVQNYRHALETNPARTLERALRDKRYDAILGKPLEPAKIDQMTDAYARRFLKYRSETIARTESIRVMEIGRHAAWAQMLTDGKVDQVLKTWHVAHDERVCPICSPIPELNLDPLALDAFFDSPIGPVQMGPLHPDCRCFVFYEASND